MLTRGIEARGRLAQGTAMALLALLGLTGAVQAQEQTQLPTITVTGDNDGAAGAGNNETVLKADDLTGGSARRKIDEELRRVPGVFTRVNAGQPGVAVNIRGFEGSGRVNATVDGVRQSFRFTGHEASGFVYVDPNLLASVDIRRGAVTGAGGGGLAGSVDFRTIGFDDVVAQGQDRGSMVRFSYGENGTDYSEMLATGVRVGSVDLVGAISRRDSKSYTNGDGDIVARTGQELSSGLVKARWNIDPNQSAEFGAVFYNNDFYGNSYYQTIDSKVYTAKYHYDAGDGLIDLRANLHASDVTMEYTGGTGSYVGRKVKDKGRGGDVSNTSEFALGGGTLRSVNGFEIFRDDVSAIKSGVNPTDGRLTTSALFTDNVWTLGQFELSGGLRWNHYKLEGTGQRGSTSFDVDNSDSSVDPKVTLAYSVLDGLQPYVTWSRTMRAPTTQETLLGGVHPGSTVAGMVPNADLKAETAKGWEVGVNFALEGLLTGGDKLSGRIAGYEMDVDDYIASAYSFAAGGYRYVNVAGTSKTKGLEIETTYDIDRYTLGLGYTKTDSELPSQTAGLGASQYMPDEIVTVTADARFMDNLLTVGATFDHVSGGLVSDFTGVANEGGKDYNLLGLHAKYTVRDGFDLNVRVANVFDEAYTPFLSTSGSGQGRTFYVGGQLKF